MSIVQPESLQVDDDDRLVDSIDLQHHDQPGTVVQECQRNLRRRKCYKCGKKGHVRKRCPSAIPNIQMRSHQESRTVTIRKSYSAKGPGHRGKACLKAPLLCMDLLQQEPNILPLPGRILGEIRPQQQELLCLDYTDHKNLDAQTWTGMRNSNALPLSPFRCHTTSSDGGSAVLQQFGFPLHIAPVNCVPAVEPWKHPPIFGYKEVFHYIDMAEPTSMKVFELLPDIHTSWAVGGDMYQGTCSIDPLRLSPLKKSFLETEAMQVFKNFCGTKRVTYVVGQYGTGELYLEYAMGMMPRETKSLPRLIGGKFVRYLTERRFPWSQLMQENFEGWWQPNLTTQWLVDEVAGIGRNQVSPSGLLQREASFQRSCRVIADSPYSCWDPEEFTLVGMGYEREVDCEPACASQDACGDPSVIRNRYFIFFGSGVKAEDNEKGFGGTMTLQNWMKAEMAERGVRRGNLIVGFSQWCGGTWLVAMCVNEMVAGKGRAVCAGSLTSLD